MVRTQEDKSKHSDAMRHVQTMREVQHVTIEETSSNKGSSTNVAKRNKSAVTDIKSIIVWHLLSTPLYNN